MRPIIVCKFKLEPQEYEKHQKSNCPYSFYKMRIMEQILKLYLFFARSKLSTDLQRPVWIGLRLSAGEFSRGRRALVSSFYLWIFYLSMSIFYSFSHSYCITYDIMIRYLSIYLFVNLYFTLFVNKYATLSNTLTNL